LTYFRGCGNIDVELISFWDIKMRQALQRLRDWQKTELEEQVRELHEGWEEEIVSLEVKSGACEVLTSENVEFGDSEQHYLLYRCDCGHYEADFDDYSGRELEDDRCPKCNAHYDYSEKELTEL